jgi:hypothetical protein
MLDAAQRVRTGGIARIGEDAAVAEAARAPFEAAARDADRLSVRKPLRERARVCARV